MSIALQEQMIPKFNSFHAQLSSSAPWKIRGSHLNHVYVRRVIIQMDSLRDGFSNLIGTAEETSPRILL